MANQLKGEGTKSNLRDWAEYAKRNSYDQSESKAQSKRDLAPVEKFVAEEVTQAIGKWCPTRPNLKGAQQLHRQGWLKARLTLRKLRPIRSRCCWV